MPEYNGFRVSVSDRNWNTENFSETLKHKGNDRVNFLRELCVFSVVFV